MEYPLLSYSPWGWCCGGDLQGEMVLPWAWVSCKETEVAVTVSGRSCPSRVGEGSWPSPTALSVFPALVLSVSPAYLGPTAPPIQGLPHECLLCTEVPPLIFH